MKVNKPVYLNIFQNSPNGMFIIENDNVIDCNNKTVNMLAYTDKDQLLYKNISDINPKYQPNGKHSKKAMDEASKVSLKQGSCQFEWVLLKSNNEPIWAEVTLTNISTDTQSLLLATWKEIVDIKQKENYIGDYETIFKYAKMGLAIIDAKTKFLDANDAYLNMVGYTKPELLQYSGLDISVEKDVSSSQETVSRVAREGYIENFEKSYIRKDGEVINVDMSLALLPDEKRILISVRDITKTKRIEKELKDSKEILRIQAHYDNLTGLPNRALFQDRLSQAVHKSQRQQSKFAMLFIDLDNFKTINDAFGHETGDQFLIQVANKISSHIRISDTFSRIGGDEFTIILNEINEPKDVISFVNKIFDALKDDIIINNHKLNANMSVGITICPDDTNCSEKIMINSDVAMYHVKENGKNNFAFYHDDMNQESLKRIEIESELIKALKHDELTVYYQPQIDAKMNTLIGTEALVRWRHPQKGLISPSMFIPIAKETGLMPEIDIYVMKEAMKQMRTWYDKGYDPGKISLNLPIKQIERDGCIPVIKRILEDTRCLPEWVEFEITENDLMIDPEKALETLHKIRLLNIDLAIDDFGMGYSSFSYLKKFPITKLKIDKSFIKDLPHDDEDIAISKAIIALASSLNINVIAEGVETEAQKDFLLQNHCRNIQGYFYSKPISAKELEERFLKV